MRPVFIGGTGRSGTTILKQVLAAHARVASNHSEFRLIIDPDGLLDLHDALTTQWSPQGADLALHRFREMADAANNATRIPRLIARAWTRLGISPRRYAVLQFGKEFPRGHFNQRTQQFMEELAPHTMRGHWVGSPSHKIRPHMHETPYPPGNVTQAIQTYMDDLYRANNPNADIWLEDTPYNVCHAQRLLALWPNAHIIHMARDPRDVVASYRTFAWGGQNAERIAHRLAAVYNRWDEQKQQLPKKQVTEVSLEALSADPQTTILKLLKRLGLQADDGLTEALSKLQPKKMHGGRWRRDLSPDEQETIQNILADAIQQYAPKT